jgi:hypothetical protein
MRRRLTSTTIVLISLGLLIALSLTWTIHLIIIAVNGAVYFKEQNPFILWGEIAITFFIILFGIYGLNTQINRLGERRRDIDKKADSESEQVFSPSDNNRGRTSPVSTGINRRYRYGNSSVRLRIRRQSSKSP